MDKVKLQHERDRGPGEFVLVNGIKYELDAAGVVEVPEAEAAKLQMGAKWRPVEYWDKRRHLIAEFTPPVVQGGSRRVRTRDELLATAEASGLAVEEPAVEQPAAAAAIESRDPIAKKAEADVKAHAQAELQGEEVEIVVSEDMSKSELTKLARDCGFRVDKKMTKSQIIDLFPGE